MHPRIVELLAYVDRETEKLKDVYQSVPPDRRNVRTDPARWSPAEVVKHLAIVDGLIVRRLSALIEEARALPPETESKAFVRHTMVARVLDQTNPLRRQSRARQSASSANACGHDLMSSRWEFDGVAVSVSYPADGSFNGC